MSFGFDPEVPAGYQDADIEMLEMREAANEAQLDTDEANNEVILDDQDLTLLLELVVQVQADEMVDGILIRNSPSHRLVSLKSLEMRLIRMRNRLL